MKIFVDSNIFLRFLLADHKIQSPACKKLFEIASEGKVKLITLPIVIAEIVWVLHSYYKEKKKQVAKKIKVILLFEALEITERNVLLSAIETFEVKNIDFIDTYISSWLKHNKINKIYSYDKDYEQIEGIERKEP